MAPMEDTEDCLGRITVGLTRSKTLTLLVSPLDMMGLIGMAQVIATIAMASKASEEVSPPGIGPSTTPSWSYPPRQSPTYFMTTKPTSQRAYDIDSF